MSWIEHYMMRGLVWAFGADGPLAYDCWHFVRLVQREQFGRVLPSVQIAQGVARAVLSDECALVWRVRDASETPADGDIVEMHRPGDLHVGVWAGTEGGGILHCNSTAGAPSWTPFIDAEELFSRIKFWTVR